MASKQEAKRYLLRMTAIVLSKDDDFFPEDLDANNPKEYARWEKARDELVAEFERRSEGVKVSS